MRKSISKLIGVAVLGLLAAVVAVPAGSAVAQTVGRTCSFTVNPDTFKEFPASTTVSGTAPAGSHVRVYVQTNVAQTPVVAAVVDVSSSGAFSTPIGLTGPTTITVNFSNADNNGYATGCAQTLGVSAVRIDPVHVAGALAFTGSSNTPSIALIGTAAVVVGLALVVGVRRKAQVRS